MTGLAARAELIKLGRALGAAPEQLSFLSDQAPEVLRHLRVALSDRIFDERRQVFRALAGWARWLPAWLAAGLVRWWLGPRLTARIAGELPAWRAAAISRFLPAFFMAEVAVALDPRSARELIGLLPVSQVAAIARILLDKRDFVTIGRFVGLMPDEVVCEVAGEVADEGDLLEIVFHLESRERIDHLVRILPPERIHKAMMIVCDPSRRELWPKLLALVTNVGYGLKRELGDLAAQQGDEVLAAIVRAAQEEDLWADILPVVVCLSPDVQRRVVNLPFLLDAEVMRSILRAADESGLWTSLLTLAASMNDAGRDAVAVALSDVSRDVFDRIAYAALLRAQFDTVLDIVGRLPVARHGECLQVLEHYVGGLDADTVAYIHGALHAQGLAHLVPPTGEKAAAGPTG